MAETAKDVLNDDKGLQRSVFKAKFSILIAILFTISNVSKIVGITGIYGLFNSNRGQHYLESEGLPYWVKIVDIISYQIFSVFNSSSTFYVYKWLESKGLQKQGLQKQGQSNVFTMNTTNSGTD